MCADKAVESAVTWKNNTAQAPSAASASVMHVVMLCCSEHRTANEGVKAAAMVRRGGTLLHLELGLAAARRSGYGRAAAVLASRRGGRQRSSIDSNTVASFLNTTL